MIQAILFSTLLLLSHNLWAQSFEWVQEGSGSGQDVGEAVVSDQQGNVYATGYYSGSARFDGVLSQGRGLSEMFLAKYNDRGDLQWVKSAGGALRDAGKSVTLDHEGNIYVAGYFTGTASFGSSSTNDLKVVNSAGNSDIFIAKYTPSGIVLWVRRFGGSLEDQAHDVVFSSDESLYVTGHFSASANFGNNSLQSIGVTDIFIAKFDLSGNPLWAKSAGGVGVDKSFKVSVDPYFNAYITGFFYYNLTFNNSSTMLNADGLSSDGYIASYSPDGSFRLAKRIGGPFNDVSYSIASDSLKSIFITGYFLELAVFDSDSVFALGYNDVFIAKLDSLGTTEWVTTGGGVALDIGTDIGLDDDGNVYVAGSFDSSAVFGNNRYDGVDYFEIFLAKYNKKGILLSFNHAGGDEGDLSRGLFVENNGTVYLTGYYKNNADFEDIKAAYSDENDMFLTKISPELVSIDEKSRLPTFKIYPNPTTSQFIIELPALENEMNFVLISAAGKIVTEININSIKSKIDISDLSAGIYFAHLYDQEKTITKRIVLF